MSSIKGKKKKKTNLVVLPVPGGPVMIKLGMLPSRAITCRRAIVSSLPTMSLSSTGRYFSTHGSSGSALLGLELELELELELAEAEEDAAMAGAAGADTAADEEDDEKEEEEEEVDDDEDDAPNISWSCCTSESSSIMAAVCGGALSERRQESDVTGWPGSAGDLAPTSKKGVGLLRHFPLTFELIKPGRSSDGATLLGAAARGAARVRVRRLGRRVLAIPELVQVLGPRRHYGEQYR